MQDGTESIASLDPGADGVLPIGVIRFFWSRLAAEVSPCQRSLSWLAGDGLQSKWADVRWVRRGRSWREPGHNSSLQRRLCFRLLSSRTTHPRLRDQHQNYYYYLHSVTPVTTPSC